MSIKKIVIALYEEIKLEVVSSVRYRFSIISDILVFSIFLGFLITTSSGQSFGNRYGYDNYRELFIIGYIAWSLALAGLSASTDSISTELSRGIFYRKVNSKCPLFILLFGELLATLLLHLIVVGVLCVLAILVWDVKLHISLFLIITLFISTVGMFGVGLLIAGFAIRYKRVNSLIMLFQLGLLFITDTLPSNSIVLICTQVLPLTTCNHVLRTYIVSNTITYQFGYLIVLSLIWLMIGFVMLKYQITKAKKMGTLLFY